MTRWYRAYEGTVTEAKLGEAAMVAECSRSVAIATWHAILESCATVNDRGRFDTTPRRVAVILCEPPRVIEALFTELQSLGMIENGVVCAWVRRQFESDNSTERSRRHRETRRNAGATLQGRDETPPEADTETETIANAIGADAPPPVDPKPTYTDVKHELWAEAKPLMASLGFKNAEAGKIIGRWLKDTGDDHAGVLDAIRRARDAKPFDPISWITAALPSKGKNLNVSKPRSVQQLAKEFDDAISKFGATAPPAMSGGGSFSADPPPPRLLPPGRS